MATIDMRWIKYLGWNSQGDLGPLTMYTNKRRKLVWYAKMPPLNPPSVLQVQQRARFANAADAWADLGADGRHAWNQIAIKARLRIHGYNLFSYWYLKGDNGAIHTLERQTQIQVLPS